MAANDTISDMLTRIRNACMVKHPTTQVPATKMTLNRSQISRKKPSTNNQQTQKN